MVDRQHKAPPVPDPKDARARKEPIRGADETDPRGPSPFAPTPEDAPRDRSGEPRLDEPEATDAKRSCQRADEMAE